jgi:GNAT superfamily N-acetyltransferase
MVADTDERGSPRSTPCWQTAALVLIREATPEDWAAIWPFLRSIVAAGETFAYDQDMDEDQARAIWFVEAPGRTTVAVGADGTVIGSASMYPNHDGPGAHIASASFMVEPASWGQGAGRAMVEDALEWAREQGYRGMQFNAVAETNTHAIALYESLGFEILATIPEGFQHPTEGYVGLHVMYRSL